MKNRTILESVMVDFFAKVTAFIGGILAVMALTTAIISRDVYWIIVSLGIWIIIAMYYYGIKYFAAILYHLENISLSMTSSADATYKSPPPRVPLIPKPNRDARKRAVEEIKESGFKSTSSIKTEEGFTVAVDDNKKELVVIYPDGKHCTFTYEQFVGVSVVHDEDNGFIYGVEAVIHTMSERIHVVTLDCNTLESKNAATAKREAEDIYKLLMSVKSAHSNSFVM